MNLKIYLNEEELDEARWRKYLASSAMLRGAVDMLSKITALGYKAYIVGGAVRDIFLGHEPHDIDIATNLPIEQLRRIFPHNFEIGKSKDFGIIGINHQGHSYEVAQFRQDGAYVDGRRPESVQICQTFQQDAARRDFCINAMGIDKNGQLLDYFDGRSDIKNKVIRTVGNPHDRFEEDYIRMMRAVRFSTRLGFDIHPETKSAIKSKAQNIESKTKEAIKDELVKMAKQSGDKFARAIEILDEVGLLKVILPEITRLKEFQHNVKDHPEGNVFQHTLAALRANKVADPIVNLSILLHDVGKASTHQELPGKGHTYHGHEEKSVEIIEEIAKKLKLSNEEKQALLFVAGNHMKFHKIADMKTSKVAALLKNPHFEALKHTAFADAAARQHLFDPKEWEAIIKKLKDVEAKWGNVAAGKVGRLITGERVMKLTGLKPGKKVGDIIKKVTEDIYALDITDDKAIDALIMKYSK